MVPAHLNPTKLTDIILKMDEYLNYQRENIEQAEELQTLLDDYIASCTLGQDDLSLKKQAVEIVNAMYLYCANTSMSDIYTSSYFGIVLNSLWFELAMANILVFYILDNSLNDDRFKLVTESFQSSHFKVIYPYEATELDYTSFNTALPSRSYQEIELDILEAIKNKKHIFYVEKDNSVNYLKQVISLAEEHQNSYVCVFRNKAPDAEPNAMWLMGHFRDLI
jgi:hypothetical protein